MKLASFQYLPAKSATNEIRVGLYLNSHTVLDLKDEAAARGIDTGYSSMQEIIEGGTASYLMLQEMAANPRISGVLSNSIMLMAPIPCLKKNVFCVGWNYAEHFAEGGKKLDDKREMPTYPMFFTKAPTTINAPFGVVPFDETISTQLDWEIELGVIIGTSGKNIAEADAMRHIFGYTIINDITWRDVQRRHGGQFFKGKSFDGTCPMGPVIVTADALNPTNLNLSCRVNGVTKQSSNTKHMYFKIPKLIAELSRGMTLEAGDIISTGTPEGVGFARTPPEWLKPGDLLESEIEGIGTMRNPIGTL